MRVVFCIYEFSESNRPLQPWLTIDRVGLWMSRQGSDVHIITDIKYASDIDGITVHCVSSFRGSASNEIIRLLKQLQPDYVVTTVTPLNLASSQWFGAVPARWIAFASYAFYQSKEILRATRWVSMSRLTPYARHILIPKHLWAGNLKRRFDVVVCQSSRTAERIKSACGLNGGLRVEVIPPGIQTDIWDSKTKPAKKNIADAPFLYVGASRAIRGYSVLLRALRIIKQEDIRLRVLARGANNSKLDAMHAEIADLGLSDLVELVGGWMEPSALADEVRHAYAVILPFILVPSELPVSVVEALAVGTPVIATDIDGLPSAVRDAGLIVPAGDPSALANALKRMNKDLSLHDRLAERASIIGQGTLSWENIGMQWQELFDG